MLTEEQIKTDGGAPVFVLTDEETANDQYDAESEGAPAQAGSDNPYPVDAEVTRVAVKAVNGETVVVITHAFAPINLRHLIRHAEEVVNETQYQNKGRQTSRVGVEVAEANLFDAITRGAKAVVTRDGENAERDITPEQAKGMTLEAKMQALARLRECTVRVETNVGDSGIDFLFDAEGVIDVRLLVGDESAPVYVVPLKLKRPSGGRRQQLRDGFIKEDRSRKKGRLRVKITTDYTEAVRFFDQHFLGAGNVLINNRPYSDEQRQYFLDHFNPWFKSEVATAVIASYENDESD